MPQFCFLNRTLPHQGQVYRTRNIQKHNRFVKHHSAASRFMRSAKMTTNEIVESRDIIGGEKTSDCFDIQVGRHAQELSLFEVPLWWIGFWNESVHE